MRTGPQAIANAKAKRTNIPAMCQKWTRDYYGAPSVGDQDGDGDADAIDGRNSEPKNARHSDRRPAIGAPGAWSGGSKGFGHRAICIGYINGEALFRSTDGDGLGRIGNRTLSWFEKNWNMSWTGWSETISGQKIEGSVPAPGSKPEPTPEKSKTRGAKVDIALSNLVQAKATPGTARNTQIQAAIRNLRNVPFLD